MPATFSNDDTISLDAWSNYSGTLTTGSIPYVCTPEASDAELTPDAIMREQGDSIRRILDFCFSQPTPEPIRTMGSKYSFSSILRPSRVILDTPNMTKIRRVPVTMLTDGYQANRGAQGSGVPILVEGGTTVSSLNRRLANIGLALQTSGAGDGHRIAGCIATGTHGSALRVGAVHDTVLGIHLVISPDKALFVQSGTSPCCTEDWARWLEQQTGIPTEDCADDDAFHTTLVALGSLGIVFSVVIETIPLYRLQRKTTAFTADDATLWNAIDTLDTSALHPERQDAPHHFDVLFHPYPSGTGPGAWATLMWKTSAAGVPPTYPFPTPHDMASDTVGLIGSLAQALGGVVPLSTEIIRAVIDAQLTTRMAGSDGTVAFPGEIFGPTTLPEGKGASTEIVLDQRDARRALAILFDVLDSQASQGNHLLGAVAVRFIPETRAFLGMNIRPMSCYIELPSISNDDVRTVYRACWNALRDAGIAFTCHWGQLHGMLPEHVQAYFGARATAWRNTRATLLSDNARKVFAAPLLREVGLHS